MSNVLPPEALRRVRSISTARAISTASLLGLIAAFIAFLALLPSYLALATSATPSYDTGAPKQDSDRKEISRAQSLITSLRPIVATTTAPTAVIREALRQKPASVSVDQFAYVAGSPGTLTIGGSSKTREGLRAYRDALSADTFFTSVSVPVGDLIGEDDQRFAIILLGNF